MNMLKNTNIILGTHTFRMYVAGSFFTVILLNIKVASHTNIKKTDKRQKFYFMHPCDEKKIYLRTIFKN